MRLTNLFRKKKPKPSYWERRQNSVYLEYVSGLVRFVGRDARSILDVGSRNCPYLDWFDWIPRRVSLDLDRPYRSETVEGIRADFLSHEFAERFDVCLCLQVLEHIPDVERFARKLLAVSPRVIVSVPYRWPVGQNKNHIHDPVDEQKIRDWFGRDPDYSLLAREVNRPVVRLICYFQA